MSPSDRRDYPAEWERMVKRARRRAGERCQGCGCRDLEDGTNATRLTVHHPDRDKANAGARLTVLCAGCHLAVEPRARLHEQRAVAAQGVWCPSCAADVGAACAGASRVHPCASRIVVVAARLRRGVTLDQMELA